MATWNDVLGQLGLERVAEQVIGLARESIRFSGVERTESTSHRLGGRPNLPAGFDWPEANGTPLAFLAQFDLASMPVIECMDLPQTGTLYFFWGGLNMGAGYAPGDRGAWRVACSEAGLAGLQLREFPDGLDDELRFGPVRLVVERTEATFPGGEDMAVHALSLTAAERRGYERFKAVWDSSLPAPSHRIPGYPSWCNTVSMQASFDERRPCGLHRIGGFPDYIQHDPKLDAHLVSQGLYCGDSSGYDQGRERGLFPGAVNWELLLQLDSEQAAEVSLGGDVGRVHFLIHKDDLRDRRFENTWLVFECF